MLHAWCVCLCVYVCVHKCMLLCTLQLQTDLSDTQDKVMESQTSAANIDSQLKPTEVTELVKNTVACTCTYIIGKVTGVG